MGRAKRGSWLAELAEHGVDRIERGVNLLPHLINHDNDSVSEDYHERMVA